MLSRAEYDRLTARAGGAWHSFVVRPGGEVLLEDDADHVTAGYSVQKLAVAAAVLDKVDRGLVSLGDLVELPADLVLGGSGIYHLQGVWGDRLTVAGVLTSMLLVSDNTAVRLCGRLAPAAEINAFLAARAFAYTRIEPVGDPRRFRMGVTTPREVCRLLAELACGTLLSPASTAFMLRVLRWTNGYHDGIRRTMSSQDRARVATKHGADHHGGLAARHEAGIVFGENDDRPRLIYAFLADGLGEKENYGATHPAVEAHAALGPLLLGGVP